MEESELDLVLEHGRVFSNYYREPSRGMDEEEVREWRWFLGACAQGPLRYLLIALEEEGGGVFTVFRRWREWRQGRWPRHSISSADYHGRSFGLALMEYLRCMYVEQPQCGAILRAAFRFCYSILRADEEGALAEIDKAERENGQSIRGDRPRKRSGVHVLRFDFDVSGLLERLRRGMGPDVKWGGTSLIATRTQTDGSLTIYRLSAMAFNVLILADGTMDTEEIAQMIASRCTRGGDRICWLPSGQLWNGRRRTGSSKVWLDGNASKGVDWKRVELDFCSGDAEASTSSAVRPAAWGENLHRRLRIGSLLGAPHDLLSSRHWRPLRPENVRGGLREGSHTQNP